MSGIGVRSLLLISLLATMFGTPANGAERHEISGRGRFTSSVYLTRFEISAQGSSDHATGSIRFVVTFDGGGSEQTGSVSCLRVRRNRLVVAGQLTSGSFAGTYFAVRAADRGRDRRHPSDEIAWNYGVEAPVSCASFDLSGELEGHRLERGDIQIR